MGCHSVTYLKIWSSLIFITCLIKWVYFILYNNLHTCIHCYILCNIILYCTIVLDLNVYVISLQDSLQETLYYYFLGLSILKRYYNGVTWHKICLYITAIKKNIMLLLPLCKWELRLPWDDLNTAINQKTKQSRLGFAQMWQPDVALLFIS